MNKNEQSNHELWENVKQPNIHIIYVLQREEKTGETENDDWKIFKCNKNQNPTYLGAMNPKHKKHKENYTKAQYNEIA